jgi:O-antigen/teichoic acid export membrane protein
MNLFNQQLTRYRNNNLFKNMLILLSGTVASQIIILLFSPLITRLYTPKDFGAFTVFLSVLSILTVISSLRYEVAITLPKDEQASINLLILSLTITFAMSVLLVIIILIFDDYLLAFFNATTISGYIWILPISFLGAGIYRSLNMWAVRKNYYKDIARTKLTQSISQIITQLVFGFVNGPLGLIAGDAVGRTNGSGFLMKRAYYLEKKSFKRVTFKGIINMAKRYKKFPLYSSWSALLNSIGLQLPSLLIVFIFGPIIGGLYALTQRVIASPLSMIGNTVAQVYVGEVSRLIHQDSNKIKKLFLKTTIKLFLIGLLPLSIIILIGPLVFGYVFGNEWTDAGKIAQIMAISFFMSFIIVPVSQTLNILERQDLQLYWDIGRLVMVLITFGYAYFFKIDYSTFFIMLSISMTITYLLLVFITYYAINKYEFRK